MQVLQALFGLFIIVSGLAMFTWFGWAVGSAVEENFNANKSPYATGIGGDAIGALIGLVCGILLMIQFF